MERRRHRHTHAHRDKKDNRIHENKPSAAIVGLNADKYCTENKDYLYFVDRDVFCYRMLCMELGHSRIRANPPPPASSHPPSPPAYPLNLEPNLKGNRVEIATVLPFGFWFLFWVFFSLAWDLLFICGAILASLCHSSIN